MDGGAELSQLVAHSSVASQEEGREAESASDTDLLSVRRTSSKTRGKERTIDLSLPSLPLITKCVMTNEVRERQRQTEARKCLLILNTKS